jgi:hypothetical protein
MDDGRTFAKCFIGFYAAVYLAGISACTIGVMSDPSKSDREATEENNRARLVEAFNAYRPTVELQNPWNTENSSIYGIVSKADGQCTILEAHQPASIDASGNFATLKPETRLSTKICKPAP